MIKPNEAEIMAPVGNYESLAAAINAGADSVYFGIMHLNMRSKAANNFAIEDLKKIVEICKKNNVKTYLTVNTLLYDHDVTFMKKIIDAALDNKIDAIIAFDFACVTYCNEIGIPVHLSVQFSISNYEAVKFFAKFTNRIVLARELTLAQIKDIYTKIRKNNLVGNEGRLMEIEAFVHGALCVAQSGRCYMSLYTYNSSANRGACRQNCRAKYKITDVDTGKELVIDNHYVMSAADICTIDFLDKLLDAGIKVMKIEGRGRSPEYVDTVVRTYKQALQDIQNNSYSKEKINDYFKKLKRVFNRKLSKGNYYLGQEVGSYSDTYGSKATEKKEYIGRVTHYFSNINVAEIKCDSGKISIDDEYFIIGATTGVLRDKIHEIRVNNQKKNSAVKGETFSIKVSKKVRKNDKLYRIIKLNKHENSTKN